MGAAFEFTEAAVANRRRKDDALNGVVGGYAAGFLAGIRGMSFNKYWDISNNDNFAARSLPMAITSCALIGAAVGTFDYAGNLAGNPGQTNEERRRRLFKHPPESLVPE
jgi:hypothetical protein